MEPEPKPRPDSKLKLLPEERQAQIAEYAHSHTLADTVAWLAESGLDISTTALGRYLSWFRLREQLARSDSAMAVVLASCPEQDPAAKAAHVAKFGNLFFLARALETQDAKAWHSAQQLALRRDQLALDSQKHKETLDARKAVFEREFGAVQSGGGISPETITKIEQELNLG